MKRSSHVLSFRLSTEYLPMLDEERKRRGLSRGDCVRALVISLLVRPDEGNSVADSQPDVSEFRELLEEVCADVARLRTATLKGFAAVLRNGGMDADQAQAVIRKIAQGA